MKFKYIIFLFAVIALGACETPKDDGMERVDMIDSLYTAFAEQDIESVLAAFSDSIEWNEAENFVYADLNPYLGPQSVAEGLFQRIGTEWEYWKIQEPESYPVGDNMVLTTGRYLAKNKASGKTLDAQFAHLWTVENGKITAFQQYTDTKQAADVVQVEAEEPEDEGMEGDEAAMENQNEEEG